MSTAGGRTLMVQGTASGVGKSWMVTALCRALRRRGYRVAPFKAQNMSNNAAVTASGGEVGRAQALQAEAAGVDVDERMNPVLLKPMADDRSDVVLMGASRPDLAEVPWMERRALLWPEVARALDGLRAEFDWVVIEGAGSPAEINLARADIVNMAVARHADAPVLLVADIDRGGAFASLVGTWTLLGAADRARIRGFVLNRFRGDPTLLGDAPEVLRRHTGVPVLGVVPWIHARLPEEDAATLERQGAAGGTRPASDAEAGRGPVGVLRLPRIANFDDVLPLEREEGLELRWVERPADLRDVQAIVVPGSRNVPGDLGWLRTTGLVEAIGRAAAGGTPVLGICGGMQMMGRTLDDPLGLEGGGRHTGLGLLPVRTVLDRGKTVRRVRARWRAPGGAGGALEGYEIHHGATELERRGRVRPSAHGCEVLMEDAGEPGRVLGYRRGLAWGTYVHGCLADPGFRAAWMAATGLGRATGAILAGAGPATALLSDPPMALPDPIDVVTDAVEAAMDLDRLFAGISR